jgi:hypothetical protein
MKTSINLRSSIAAILATGLVVFTMPPRAVAKPDPPPAWEVYCRPYVALSLVCTEAMWTAHINGTTPAYTVPGHTGNPPVTTPAYTGPNWGNSIATIDAQFPVIIYDNFVNNAKINTQMSNMQWTMWARLSTELTRLDKTGAYRPLIYKVAAQKLSANNLIMMRSAFGTVIDTYVTDYAPAAVLTAYNAGKVQPALYMSENYYVTKGIAVEVPATPLEYFDVFLMAFTQQGDANPNASLKRATTYLQVRMKLGPLDILYAAAAAITVIVEGPAAWSAISQAYNDAYNGIAQSFPEPIILTPPDGIPFTYPPNGGPGYPGGAPSLISIGDPTGGILDPDLDVIPGFDFPGDLDYDFGCLGLDSACG